MRSGNLDRWKSPGICLKPLKYTFAKTHKLHFNNWNPLNFDLYTSRVMKSLYCVDVDAFYHLKQT